MSSTPALASRNALIESHTPLVETIVNCLWRRKPVVGIEKDDLISEGYIGLVKAADTFDESRGAAFGTHAVRCIRCALCNALKAAGVRNADDVVNESLQEDTVGTPDETAASDAKLTLEAALSQLPPKRRTAVELHHLQGLNKSDVARRMQITKVHAARLIEQGMADLRAILN